MKRFLLKIRALVFLSTPFLSPAQQNTTAAGTVLVGSSGSMSFSIGQIDYFTFTGSNGSISQGVQQPYEISVLGIVKNNLLNLKLYPNPTVDYLILETNSNITENGFYQLFDINAKLVKSANVENLQTIIDMSSLSQSIYILNVYHKNNTILQSFKVIKN